MTVVVDDYTEMIPKKQLVPSRLHCSCPARHGTEIDQNGMLQRDPFHDRQKMTTMPTWLRVLDTELGMLITQLHFGYADVCLEWSRSSRATSDSSFSWRAQSAARTRKAGMCVRASALPVRCTQNYSRFHRCDLAYSMYVL